MNLHTINEIETFKDMFYTIIHKTEKGVDEVYDSSTKTLGKDVYKGGNILGEDIEIGASKLGKLGKKAYKKPIKPCINLLILVKH